MSVGAATTTAKTAVVILPFTVVLISKAVSLVAAGFLLAIGFQLGHGLCRVVHNTLTTRAYAKEEKKHEEPEVDG